MARVDEQEFYHLLYKDGISEDFHLFNHRQVKGKIITIIIDRVGPWTASHPRVTPGENRGQRLTEGLRPCTVSFSIGLAATVLLPLSATA
jgi:hypothetical protein